MEKISVFLVEDEVIIRNGVKKSIDWEQEGYFFAGEASDGELAYPIILKEKPDIVITDIRMPFMDGLELSRLVKEKLPDIRIVLLTGYGEFEYAKEAIQIGVTDYLLKPISAAKLLEALGKIRDQIWKEQEEKELLARYAKEMRENTELEKNKFFNQLLIGSLAIGQAIEKGRKYGMDLTAANYQIVLFKIMHLPESQEETQHIVEACDQIEEQVDALPYVSKFQRGTDGWAFLVLGDDPEQTGQREHTLEEVLRGVLGQWSQLEYFGAKGSVVERLRRISESFKVADRVFASRFVLAPNQILDETSVKEVHAEDFEMDGIVHVNDLRSMLGRFLNNGTREEVGEFCDAYLGELQQEQLSSNILRQYLIVDVSVEILAFVRKLSPDSEFEREAENLKRLLQNTQSVEDFRNYLVGFLQKTIDVRDTVSGRKYTDVIEAAKREIEENYMTEDISLNTVSVKVGMSPSYFSSVFSKEMGMTFVEYLTEVRMNKAKELIMCSPMKMSEIAFEVGYRDPHYFSYIFKKTQGCSPKEYRARGKE